MIAYPTTFLGLVSEKYNEVTESKACIGCYCTAVGSLQIDLHRLISEVSRGAAEEDTENLLEILVALAVTCTEIAEALVLPALKGDVE